MHIILSCTKSNHIPWNLEHFCSIVCIINCMILVMFSKLLLATLPVCNQFRPYIDELCFQERKFSLMIIIKFGMGCDYMLETHYLSLKTMSVDSENTQFMIELNHFQKYLWQLRDMFDTFCYCQSNCLLDIVINIIQAMNNSMVNSCNVWHYSNQTLCVSMDALKYLVSWIFHIS